jgi:transcriptional regulator with XRE-family HTH domain
VKAPRLREWREAMGETQVTLAEKSGVAEHTISRIEHGASLRPTTARKLADALDVAVADLLERPPVPLVEAPPETGFIRRTVHSSAGVSDEVKPTIFGHLDALEAALKTHGLNGELLDMVEQMRRKVAA